MSTEPLHALYSWTNAEASLPAQHSCHTNSPCLGGVKRARTSGVAHSTVRSWPKKGKSSLNLRTAKEGSRMDVMAVSPGTSRCDSSILPNAPSISFVIVGRRRDKKLGGGRGKRHGPCDRQQVAPAIPRFCISQRLSPRQSCAIFCLLFFAKNTRRKGVAIRALGTHLSGAGRVR